MLCAETLANLLSTLTIVSCMFLKLPQILQMRCTGKTDGLYLQAMVMEVLGFTTMTLYNYMNGYSLITYLEYPIILLQVYVMVFYFLEYNCLTNSPMVLLALVAYVTMVLSFIVEVFPKETLDYLVPLCTPLSGFAKVTYIYGIIATGNADAVSNTTWILSIATNLSRVFTVYMDSRDVKLMTNFTISGILSSGVLVTAMVYKYQPRCPPAPCSPPRGPRRRRKSHSD